MLTVNFLLMLFVFYSLLMIWFEFNKLKSDNIVLSEILLDLVIFRNDPKLLNDCLDIIETQIKTGKFTEDEK